ncbi:MAG: hypothetical protein ACPG4T_06805, partial [Nannocystaceae bacterium]
MARSSPSGTSNPHAWGQDQPEWRRPRRGAGQTVWARRCRRPRAVANQSPLIVPRPSLRAAVVAAVTNLKNAEGELEAARLRGDQVEIDRLEEVVEHQLLFLRSQDIDVDIGVAFDESTLDHRLVEYDSSEDEQAATRVNVRGGKLYRELLQTPVDTEHSSTFHNGL